MTIAAPKLELSYVDYAKLEEASELKHQYLGGEVFAMAGGSPAHAKLAARIIGALAEQLGNGPCEVYSSDLRVRMPSGLGTYPDVTVVCGPIAHDADDENSITNPSVVVEVLSDSTEAFDRGDKFEHYRSLTSLRDYVLVSQKKPLIERYAHNDDGSWTLTTAASGERVTLSAIACTLDVDAIYRGMFSTPAT